MTNSRSEILRNLGRFWTEKFTDSAFLNGFVEFAAGQLDEQLRKASVGGADPLAPGAGKLRLAPTLITLTEQNGRSAQEGVSLPGAVVNFEQGKTFVYKLSPAVDFEYLTALRSVLSDLLAEGIDFSRSGDLIFSKTDLVEYGQAHGTAIAVNPDGIPTVDFWTFCASVELPIVYNAYGWILDLYSDDPEMYSKIVRTCIDLRMEGATQQNTHRLLSHLTGVDPIEKGGVLHRIYTEGDREVAEVSGQLYTAPTGTAVLVDLLGEVQPYSTLFDTFSVGDVTSLSAHGATVDGKMAPWLKSYAVLLPNWDVPVVGGVISPGSFEIAALPEASRLFFAGLNAFGFFRRLKQRYGRVPSSINPAREFFVDAGLPLLFVRTGVYAGDSRLLTGAIAELHQALDVGTNLQHLVEQPFTESVPAILGHEEAEVYDSEDLVEQVEVDWAESIEVFHI